MPIERFKATDKLSTKWVYMSVEVDLGPVTLVGNITSSTLGPFLRRANTIL